MSVQTKRRGTTASSHRAGLPVTSGLRGWWKADAITSPPADGGLLQTWTDSATTPHDATQATSADRPTYRTSGAFLPNSKPVVEFSSANTEWMAASVTNSGTTTRFVVYRPKTVGIDQALFTKINGYELWLDSSNHLGADVPNVASLSLPASTTIAASTWYVFAFDSNGSNSHHTFINGTAEGTSTVSAVATATSMEIGARGTFTSKYCNGYMAEIIDYDRVLSGSERDQVTSYLGTKYGISVSTSGGGSDPVFFNLDFDTSETQSFTHSLDQYTLNLAHQHAWLTSPTRLGTGHSERLEIHNDPNDRANGGTERYRARVSVHSTNNGGLSDAECTGYDDVYWCWSMYWPISPDSNATVTSGFSQVALPYTSFMEFHDHGDSNPSGAADVQPHFITPRDGDLELVQRCGTFTWTGSTWNRPTWNVGTPGTNGSNDRIKIPIVKASGTNPTLPTNTWVDVIWHVRFRTDSTGLTEIWARETGQSFTADNAPNLTISGPTHRTVINQDSSTYITNEIVTSVSPHVSGMYIQGGVYNGSGSWTDGTNGANIVILDEWRRHGTLAAAKANWG